MGIVLRGHRLLQPGHRQETAAKIQAAITQFPTLPNRETGNVLVEEAMRGPIVNWYRFGFNFMRELGRVRGPLIEVGGPTPIWNNPTIRDEKCWGLYLDITRLPKPLTVVNIRTYEESVNGLLGPYACDHFMQADATQLPFRNNSVGALFTRGLGLLEWGDDGNVELIEQTNTLRLAMLEEAWRVLEMGGQLYQIGARLGEVAYARSLGFVLRAYAADQDPVVHPVPICENVFFKPRAK